MNTRKIQIRFLSSLTLAFFALPFVVYGADPGDTKVELKLPNAALQGIKTNIYSVFNNIFTFIFGIAFAIATLGLIANGIRYIAAFGNEEQVEKAKNGVYYSIMGLIILLLAFTIASTVNYIFAPK